MANGENPGSWPARGPGLIRLLPLIAGLLPIAAIHGSYFLAIRAARVPACIPYIEGCTSISATGRYPPASYLFKAVMLPEALLLAVFWLLSVAWLRALANNAGQASRPPGRITGSMGTAGALCLILYVTFLGTDEPFYEFMRRFGVYLYFLLTVLAQLGLAFRARQLSVLLDNPRLKALTEWQLLLGGIPFVLGIVNLVLKSVLADPDQAENVIEWIFALLMQCYFLLAWEAWRHTGFSASYRVSIDPAKAPHAD
jgi:hypothetical protein